MLLEQRPACNDRDQQIAKFEHIVGRMAREMEKKLISSPHRKN